MHLADFDFKLPEHLIADRPLAQRSASRLLCLAQTQLQHRHFYELTDFLKPGDLLIFNDTKVIPARLYGHKKSGGRVEILIERILNNHAARVQMRVSKPPRIGDDIIFAEHVRLTIAKHEPPFYELVCDGKQTIMKIMQTLGEVPLPHYMRRNADERDQNRYQTIYAKKEGSVAAPTAGFHFDDALFAQLHQKSVEFAFVTLHIGAGTFAPIRVTNILEHQMHAEYFTVSAEICEKVYAAKTRGSRVIVVGTTTLRALESASIEGEIKPFAGDTQLFIYPGFQFHCADVLITNFHLPRSSLLILVCAFGGYQHVLSAYHEAIAKAYRFYSYGDAMWIEKNSGTSRCTPHPPRCARRVRGEG